MSSEQRSTERLFPGPTSGQLEIVVPGRTTPSIALVLDESLGGLAIQTRKSSGIELGAKIEVGRGSNWRRAVVRSITTRGPFHRIGLQWTDSLGVTSLDEAVAEMPA